MKKGIIASILCFVVIIAIGFSYLSYKPDVIIGSAPDGVTAVTASSTVYTVAGTAVALFASSTSSTSCASRAISTGVSSINLSFNPDITPTATLGHIQATSSTVIYDSGLYGCGPWKAISLGASSQVNVSEFR